MNFLTEKYKEKLEIEEYFRKYLIIVTMAFIGFYIIAFGIGRVEKSVQAQIDIQNNQILQDKKRMQKLTQDSKKETDLGVQIEIIEDIFAQKNLRVSEIFKSLKGNVPKNVWLQSLTYEGNVVRIRGYSFRDNVSKTSEQNAYYFEKRMLDSGLYKSVELSFLKKGTKYGDKINEFEYVLTLK